MATARIIRLSVAVCVGLLVAYSAVIAIGIPPQLNRPESQWAANIVAAEGWLYRSDTPPVVIVGSSMARRLTPDLFAEGSMANLSFSGKSVFDGLTVLARSGKTPKLVLVETNLLTRPADRDFTDALFTPVVGDLKAAVPALRDSYRPFTQLQRIALITRDMVHKGVRAMKRTVKRMIAPMRENRGVATAHARTARPPRPAKAETAAHPLFERMLQRQVATHAEIPTEAATRQAVEALKTLVDRVRANGSTVVLFEMPMHPQLCDSPRRNHMRAALAAAMPQPRYPRLPRPDCTPYHTADGIHLERPEARRFAAQLTATLRRLAGH